MSVPSLTISSESMQCTWTLPVSGYMLADHSPGIFLLDPVQMGRGRGRIRVDHVTSRHARLGFTQPRCCRPSHLTDSAHLHPWPGAHNGGAICLDGHSIL